MEALVNLMPTAWQPMAKFIVGTIGIVLTVLSTTLPQSPLWLTIALGVFSAWSVYQAPANGYVAPADAYAARVAKATERI